ncbi:unnamed protein product, partial [Brugia pahangi]|uniref:Zinc finger protein n=1 Tax=Brugia pahangi TaxID=6280 RepID=A0A0N4T3Q5_BRUPA
NFISFKVAQTEQTEPLDLSISKVKEKRDGLQGLSVKRVSDGRIKPQRQLAPIETIMEVIELPQQKESTGKKRRCNICQKEITHMKIHMMIHTGEKPYSCPICKRNFIQSWHIKNHVMIHTGEKTYSCFICGKSYTLKRTLRTHMVTHEMRRPIYNCTVCSKDFQAKSSLIIIIIILACLSCFN